MTMTMMRIQAVTERTMWRCSMRGTARTSKDSSSPRMRIAGNLTPRNWSMIIMRYLVSVLIISRYFQTKTTSYSIASKSQKQNNSYFPLSLTTSLRETRTLLNKKRMRTKTMKKIITTVTISMSPRGNADKGQKKEWGRRCQHVGKRSLKLIIQ